jgi:hypothetical protein
MLRQQLIVAARKVKRARFKARDRLILVALSNLFARWREALLLVKPETVLRWHRQGFRLLWAWRSKVPRRPRTRLAMAVVALIKRIATENRRWGAERIRGELLKLGYSAAKSTSSGTSADSAARRPRASAGRHSCAIKQKGSGAATSSRYVTSGSAATRSSS